MNDVLPARIPRVLSGPGVYRTANGRRATWSVGNEPYEFAGKRRVRLAVENSTGEGQFTLSYLMDGTPDDAFRSSLNTPEFRIVAKEGP